MNIKTFYLGSMMTNCYITWNDDKIAYLFDCGGENIDKIMTFLKVNGLTLKYLILTHGHGDHIAGINRLVEEYPNVEVYIGKEDAACLTEPELNLMRYITGANFVFNGEVHTIKEGDMVGEFEVLDTPGHTIGSKSFYCSAAKMLISGDTMFRRSYGRYDLPTGNINSLYESLEKLSKLPEKTVVYSAHSEPTTIAEEKIFLRNIGVLF
ncbi:MAG: MBL fold metallo-hydrolase [Fusobacterium varium]|nr:MBL fold metallo-hydrolase [Fusobacterium varium]